MIKRKVEEKNIRNFRSRRQRNAVTHTPMSYIRSLKLNWWLTFYFIVYLVLVIKLITIQEFDNNVIFATYSIAVSVYILSRFAVASFHKHDHKKFNPSFEPTISFGVPSMNEEENIRETILRIAKTDYPKNKFNIIAVNDGSTDDTLNEMLIAKEIAKKEGVSVKVVDWKRNKGKREGMAECVKQSKNEILIFIDSDSFVEPSTAKQLIKYFDDAKVAAVAGHAYVANANKNIITKMQAVRYYVAFKAYKGTESVFGAVTCCSGCCSAYRRSYIAPMMKEWLSQKFLGITCTYGDDRSLTNFLLKAGYKALYSENARAYTFAPDTFRKFMKQQLRWKKSWVRESLIAAKFMWRKHPFVSISYYLSVLLPLLAPVIVVRALLWFPIATGKAPLYYLSGLVLMCLIYGLYYRINTNDKRWIYGTIFAVFYTVVLIWQLPYAILSLRNAKWGTR